MDALCRSLVVAAGFVAVASASADDDTWTLTEDASTRAVFDVRSKVAITGELITPAAGGTTARWKLKSTADYDFHERRLPGSAPGAGALRAARHYRKAQAQTEVGEHSSVTRLNPNLRDVVAEGRTQGVRFFALDKPLTRETLDLISTPGDPLAVIALLPTRDVAVGERWNPDGWVLQMLTDTEIVLKNELRCELRSVEKGGQTATVTFTGHIEGVTLGASSKIDVSGDLTFDLKQRAIRQFNISRKEERTAGTVNPGLDVEVTMSWTRTPLPSGTRLTIREQDVPAEPSAEQLRLRFRAPWGLEMDHDRDWHVFTQSGHNATLRLVRGGSLVAQCNLSPVQRTEPGSHTPIKQFTTDIANTLGPKVGEIRPGATISSTPMFVHQVRVTGESDGLPLQWVYYLCADRSGQQASLVFSVAASDLQQLGKTDEQIVRSIRFPRPTRVTRDKR